MLRGLPASGKTTMAQWMMAQNPELRRVSKDDIRAMINIGPWTDGEEKLVRDIRDSIIQLLLSSGHDVVVDDTNLNPIHKETLMEIAAKRRIVFEVVDINTPLEECIRRDLNRPFTKCVGEEVIRNMYTKYMTSVGEDI